MANITFHALGAPGSISALGVNTVTFADSQGVQVNVTAAKGQIVVGRRGDVNCDNLVNSVDGLFVLQFDVGLRAASSTCPPPAGTLFQPACDVNADSLCNSIDWLVILQCDAGIRNLLCRSASLRAGMRCTHGLLMFASTVFADGSVVHWNTVVGVITAQGVDNPVADIDSGTFAWTTTSGQAAVTLKNGAAVFEVEGLVINGTMFNGPPGPITKVIDKRRAAAPTLDKITTERYGAFECHR